MCNKQKFAKWLIKKMGWRVVEGVAPEDKCIILGVPHTSVKDFVVSWAYYTSCGGTPNIMIKKEFFFWPMGVLLRKMGAIPVDRSRGAVTAKQVIDAIKSADKMHLCIAPEGTRKKTNRWKKGFHTIARQAQIPIYLGYFNYRTKEVGRGIRFVPTDDVNGDLKRIMAHYAAMNLEGRKKGQWDPGIYKQLLKEDEIKGEVNN